MKEKEFNRLEVIKDIENYANGTYYRGHTSKNKVFYHWYEWYGWRFYYKAIKSQDWRSLKKHIRGTYFWWIKIL